MRSFTRGVFLWIVVFLVLIGLYRIISTHHRPKKYEKINYSSFVELIDEGRVESVEIRGERLKGTLKDGSLISTSIPYDYKLIDRITAKGVEVKIIPKEEESLFKTLLITWLPIALVFMLWFSFIRGMERTGMRAMSFMKSKAQPFKLENQKIGFSDVAGIDEVIEEVKEIVEFLKDPGRFSRLGARIPKGVLFVGPPGSGKTLLARAIAGEAGVPFFSASGSEFVEMFVGVGAARIRDLFERAKRSAPCIIFVDEIDAVGRTRGAGIGGGHDEREQTLNQLLVELDGIEQHEGIIVIAATNRPDILDQALLRPGRFDRKIHFPLPDIKGREEILKVHARKIPLAEDVNLKDIARATPGFSGADLENIVNEAALIAAREGRDKVATQDFEKARDKVLIGAERKSLVMSKEQKRTIAYHEAGHALVAKLTPGADPVHKVTIMPRGYLLGSTFQLPTEDKYTLSKNYLISKITVLLGGRVAEEIALGDITTGSADDLNKATELARKMVCEWGMSQLGPISFKVREEHLFLGREITRTQEISESTALKIDREVEKIVEECYGSARKIIKEKEKTLHELASVLLEKETITSEEIDMMIK